MRILLTNDDGVDAPGVLALADRLKEIGEVTVVAPHRPRSACGHAITLHKPIRVWRAGASEERRWACSGTPADCVYYGLNHLAHTPPDLVVSGINHGGNFGQDTLYSGTVAGAREAALHGFAALAVSLHTDGDGPRHWATACEIALRVARHGPAPGQLWNLNLPNLPLNQVKGIKATRLGQRFYEQTVDMRTDPRGITYFWIGGGPKGFEEGDDYDGSAVEAGWASLTPLGLAVTDPTTLEDLRAWTDA